MASIPHLSSLAITRGKVTAYGVRALGQGRITQLRFCDAQLDQAAAGALASLIQLNSLQLLWINDVYPRTPAVKASSEVSSAHDSTMRCALDRAYFSSH